MARDPDVGPAGAAAQGCVKMGREVELMGRGASLTRRSDRRFRVRARPLSGVGSASVVVGANRAVQTLPPGFKGKGRGAYCRPSLSEMG